jgi:phosphoribosylformylglycinamidine cyclo-ligase
MCVNDIIVLGAEPLFFLDYYACGQLDNNQATQVIAGIADGCQQSGCALIGGETAEMPGMYEGDDYDLAGFVVGVVDKTKIIDGSLIKANQSLIGVQSTGPHSNGYSLIRKIVDDTEADLNQPFDDSTLGKKLLAPTQLYAKQILDILNQGTVIHGIAHITGGGIMENISRIIPAGLAIEVNQHSWQRPAVFEWLQAQGHIDDIEMLRTFNCGIGLCLVVDDDQVNNIIEQLKSHHLKSWLIGKTIIHTGQDVVIK